MQNSFTFKEKSYSKTPLSDIILGILNKKGIMLIDDRYDDSELKEKFVEQNPELSNDSWYNFKFNVTNSPTSERDIPFNKFIQWIEILEVSVDLNVDFTPVVIIEKRMSPIESLKDTLPDELKTIYDDCDVFIVKEVSEIYFIVKNRFGASSRYMRLGEYNKFIESEINKNRKIITVNRGSIVLDLMRELDNTDWARLPKTPIVIDSLQALTDSIKKESDAKIPIDLRKAKIYDIRDEVLSGLTINWEMITRPRAEVIVRRLLLRKLNEVFNDVYDYNIKVTYDHTTQSQFDVSIEPKI